MNLWTDLERHVQHAIGAPFAVHERRPVGGGCINEAWVVGDGDQRFFVKLNDANATAMFETETAGLAAIAATGTVRVPQSITHGAVGDKAFLVLEYLDLGRACDGNALGRRLAAMHRATAPSFGWDRSNFIGATPQPNDWTVDWIEFLRKYRIGHQLTLASKRSGGERLQAGGNELLDRMVGLFDGHRPVPSLLHGDLWGGNAAVTRSGEPVIFDPAVYYGDREADLAMTELFGGFGPRFYSAYNETWSLDSGYAVRKDLYNLYHVLNHFNLFGGGYARQAERMTERLLAQLR